MKRKLIAGISVVAVGSLVLFGILASNDKIHKSRPNIFPKDMEKECWTAFNLVDKDHSYWPKYEKCSEASAKMDEERGNYESAYTSFQTFGDIHFFEKDYDTAERYYLESIEDAKKMRDKRLEALAYLRLGDVYKEKGDKKKAKEYYTNAYNDYKTIGRQEDGEYILKLKLEKLDKS